MLINIRAADALVVLVHQAINTHNTDLTAFALDKHGKNTDDCS